VCMDCSSTWSSPCWHRPAGSCKRAARQKWAAGAVGSCDSRRGAAGVLRGCGRLGGVHICVCASSICGTWCWTWRATGCLGGVKLSWWGLTPPI
jgi:hypothetical protein